MSSIVAKTGFELVGQLQVAEPQFEIATLLTDYFKLDEIQAGAIANQTSRARVLSASDGAFALGSDQPQLVEGTRSINEYYFARRGSIVLNGVMTGIIAKEYEKDSIRPVTREQAYAAAIRTTSIFELGRFVSRKVYDLVVQNFRTANFSVPSSNHAGIAFFNEFNEELAKRGIVETWDSDSYDATARSFYERDVRPEQFATRGGLMTLSAFNSSLNPEHLLALFRERRLQEQLGSIGCQSIRNGGTVDDAASIQYPSLTEMGALIPMDERYFKILCESIQDPAQDTVVSFRR